MHAALQVTYKGTGIRDEVVPFLFTIKDLSAKGQPGGLRRV